MVCNGLGVPPEAWPRLLDPHCGYRVVGWNHRGGLGSGRPADPQRIRVEDHVADALALMEHTGIDRALLVAWSLGVNVSFEIAAEHPDKVAGMLMCRGSRGTYDAAFATLMVPRPLRKTSGLMVSRVGQLLGKPLNLLAHNVPRGTPSPRFCVTAVSCCPARGPRTWCRGSGPSWSTTSSGTSD